MYSEKLANRIRERFENFESIQEKEMMGGLTFMYNDKMCVGIIKVELMCRIDPEKQEMALQKRGARIMDFTNRPMKGYILVDESGMRSQKDFDFWIDLALEFNPKAKSSKKKSK
jgi:TfoX/Sxy family transcriptional regulator of competence genes